jgi:hypothetical protein
MRDDLHQVRERLLRGGVGGRRAQRYADELCDHRDDIAADLEKQGLAPALARAEAMRRLGSLEQLTAPMLADIRFRGPSSRWPALIYLVLPIVAQLVASAAPVALLGLVARRLPHAALPDLVSAISLAWLILPVTIGWLVLTAASWRRAGLTWPLLGAAGTVLLAAALQLDITMPGNGLPGAISVALATPAPLPLIVLFALSMLPLYLPSQLRNL